LDGFEAGGPRRMRRARKKPVAWEEKAKDGEIGF